MALLLTRPMDAAPELLSEYLAAGGYASLAKARASDTGREELLATVEASGLRGRGGAGFPAAKKWGLARAAEADEKYVVVNGGEHEPGSRKDRFLMTSYPHLVLEGAALVAEVTGAKNVVLYLIEDMLDAIASLERAIADARAAGHLDGLAVRLALAPTTYVAGEETAALEVIEGKKAWPRKKPPYPGQAGVHGKPTTVQNVETVAWTARLAQHGAAWYGEGAMLCTLDDSFAKPGLVEVPLGTTLRALVQDFGGGTRGGRPVKAILPALSSAFLPASLLDTPMTHEALRAAGSNLGCGGFSVIEEGVCVVERTLQIAEFFKTEQCGQCPPCRMETSTIAMAIKKAHAGEPGDYAAQVQKIAAFTKGKGNCSLIEMAAAPALSAIALFPEDFAAHATTGRCPV